jgi:DNA-binding LacI/PurR family transcriptional regulator
LIGVILRDISNPFFTQVDMGIEEVARQKNYSLLYYNSLESHEAEVAAIQALESFNVAGAIISPVLVGVDLGHLANFVEKGRVLVSIDHVPSVETHSVGFENEKGAFAAVQYLVNAGHRRIAYLAGPETSSSNEARFMGYRRALKSAGIAYDKELMLGAGTTPQERIAAASAMLSRPRTTRPTAIFCFNDLIAIAVYKVAHRLRLRIPQDISLVGFDDIDMAELLGPPLTTMRLHAREAGARAAEIMISAVNAKGDFPAERVAFEPELVERESVASPGG